MATYTKDELQQYLKHIDYPKSKHPDDPLAFLTELQRHHQARVPFDNIALHYSVHRLLSLDADDLFDKIVIRGRGGYCMEVNAFFANILRTLGFDVYCAGGRVKHERLSHMVNIVTIDGRKYVVDVGFGSNEPVQPIPLRDGFEFAGIPPVRCRLDLKHLPQHSHKSDDGQRLWVYAIQADETTGWEEMYSFSEMEFFREDFEVMNYWVMTRPESFFTQTVLAYRTIMDEAGMPIGQMILYKNYVKQVLRGRPEVLEQLSSEEQRVRALDEYFYIRLTEREKRAIRGLPTELKSA